MKIINKLALMNLLVLSAHAMDAEGEIDNKLDRIIVGKKKNELKITLVNPETENGQSDRQAEFCKDNKKISLSKRFSESNQQAAESEFTRGGDYYWARNGVDQNFSKAFKYFKRAAKKMHAGALNQTGVMYKNGHGVDQNDLKALKYYKRAAKAGDAWGQHNFASLCYIGDGVVEENYPKALKWFTLSANQGDADAQRMLGYIHYNGNGVDQSYPDALKWFTLSADQGNADAQRMIGHIYYNGDGVEQNYRKALKYFTTSALKGCPPAKDRLKEIFIEVPNCLIDQQMPDALKADIEEITKNLENMDTQYIFLISLSMGSLSYEKNEVAYGKNPYLEALCEKITKASAGYKQLLLQINEPGFLVSCLHFNSANDHMHSMIDALHGQRIRFGESSVYLSMKSKEDIQLLQTTQLMDAIAELSGMYTKSIGILDKILEIAPANLDTQFNALLAGVEITDKNVYSFIKAFLVPFEKAAENDRNGTLLTLKRRLSEHYSEMKDHIAYSKIINEEIVEIIKGTEGYRNNLYLTEVWN